MKLTIAERAAELSLLRQRMSALLESLTRSERIVLSLRFGLEEGYLYSKEEAALVLRVTRERIHGIECKALRKLRHPIRSRKLEPFFESLLQ